MPTVRDKKTGKVYEFDWDSPTPPTREDLGRIIQEKQAGESHIFDTTLLPQGVKDVGNTVAGGAKRAFNYVTSPIGWLERGVKRFKPDLNPSVEEFGASVLNPAAALSHKVNLLMDPEFRKEMFSWENMTKFPNPMPDKYKMKLEQATPSIADIASIPAPFMKSSGIVGNLGRVGRATEVGVGAGLVGTGIGEMAEGNVGPGLVHSLFGGLALAPGGKTRKPGISEEGSFEGLTPSYRREGRGTEGVEGGFFGPGGAGHVMGSEAELAQFASEMEQVYGRNWQPHVLDDLPPIEDVVPVKRSATAHPPEMDPQWQDTALDLENAIAERGPTGSYTPEGGYFGKPGLQRKPLDTAAIQAVEGPQNFTGVYSPEGGFTPRPRLVPPPRARGPIENVLDLVDDPMFRGREDPGNLPDFPENVPAKPKETPPPAPAPPPEIPPAAASATPDWTEQISPKTGTFGLRGPNGEKVAGRIVGDRIEMVSIGKGNAPDSRGAVEALRKFGQSQGKPVYFTSTNLSTSGGKFRERMLQRGDLEQTPEGLRLRDTGTPPKVEAPPAEVPPIVDETLAPTPEPTSPRGVEKKQGKWSKEQVVEKIIETGGDIESVKTQGTVVTWKDAAGVERSVDLAGRIGSRAFGISPRQRGTSPRNLALNPRSPLPENLKNPPGEFTGGGSGPKTPPGREGEAGFLRIGGKGRTGPIIGQGNAPSATPAAPTSTPGVPRPATIGEKAADVLNISRTLKSSLDLSMPLRQAGLFTVRHPLMAAKATKEMIKAMLTENRYTDFMTELHSRPNAIKNRYVKSGLAITEHPKHALKGKGRLRNREEAFLSTMVDWVPGVRRSNRAAVAFLNYSRAELFDHLAKKFKGLGVDDKDIAKYVNIVTGRAGLGKHGERMSGVLQSLLFSPRFLASRIQSVTHAIPGSNTLAKKLTGKELLNPKLQRELQKDWAAYATAFGAVLSVAKLGGMEVEVDPRSTDFLKIRSGKTRIDIGASYPQLARFLTQMWTAERKLPSGEIGPVGRSRDSETKKRGDVALRFARSKLNPPAGLLATAYAGRNYVGEPFDASDKFHWARELGQMHLPMFLGDLSESIGEHGIGKGALYATPSLIGGSTDVYDPNDPSRLDPQDFERRVRNWRKHPLARRFGLGE